MAESEGRRRKIVKIKRINPRTERQDGNTATSTLEEGTSRVCKSYVPEQRTKSFAPRLSVVSWTRNER